MAPCVMNYDSQFFFIRVLVKFQSNDFDNVCGALWHFAAFRDKFRDMTGVSFIIDIIIMFSDFQFLKTFFIEFETVPQIMAINDHFDLLQSYISTYIKFYG